MIWFACVIFVLLLGAGLLLNHYPDPVIETPPQPAAEPPRQATVVVPGPASWFETEVLPPATEPGYQPVSFDSFVHWHMVDGVFHERPVGGECEFCDEDSAERGVP